MKETKYIELQPDYVKRLERIEQAAWEWIFTLESAGAVISIDSPAGKMKAALEGTDASPKP